ncbi:hypothetical protein GWK48_08620 [Metallosphaera tengchongensis]|uniref:Uncharacterized protein n=1 Tax=Metallosphaera tengchongensis TaxID=1532350 RepID=A0A6N0NW41_9CREN|nr:hypothetical protein [Metallosphaera tengchongensis]QKR00427.1 hypothetical protein GWK48_08620 [Metallosphaera tengchongensis]
MESFRSVIIDVFLSSRVSDSGRIIQEGVEKRNRCNHYDGKYCNLIRTRDWILSSWVAEGKIKPHPILCFLCPYYGLNLEEKVEISLLQLLRDYISLRNSIEKEISRLEGKMGEMIYSSLMLKKRRDELMGTIEQVDFKINLIKVLLKEMESNVNIR